MPGQPNALLEQERTMGHPRSIVCLFAAAASALSACGAPPGHAEDRRALLAIYEAQRTAHFSGDAEQFLAAVDTGYWAIANGESRLRGKAEALSAAGAYFHDVRIQAVEDVAPPRITVAPDGRTAWLIGQVEVRGTRRDPAGSRRPVAFRAAWLDLYRKVGGAWRLQARVNTEREAP